MKTIAFYDAKPYDIQWFDKYKDEYGFEIKYFENRLNCDTAILTSDADAVCAFVNDDVNGDVIDCLTRNGIKILAHG